MMLTPENSDEELARVKKALVNIPKREKIDEKMPSLGVPKRVLSIREATMSQSAQYGICDALGKTLALASVSCPPAIPIVVCGEEIDEKAIEVFKYYSIEKVRCVEKA